MNLLTCTLSCATLAMGVVVRYTNNANDAVREKLSDLLGGGESPDVRLCNGPLTMKRGVPRTAQVRKEIAATRHPLICQSELLHALAEHSMYGMSRKWASQGRQNCRSFRLPCARIAPADANFARIDQPPVGRHLRRVVTGRRRVTCRFLTDARSHFFTKSVWAARRRLPRRT